MQWDEYYLNICEAVALNSKCHSRRIGAILVFDKKVIATGYNGPPIGVPECRERLIRDDKMIKALNDRNIPEDLVKEHYKTKVCPRRTLNFPSGEGLEWCDAIHAEKNCLLAAASRGVPTKGATMYLNADVSPCSQCLGACINAGIVEIVVLKNVIYDATVEWVLKHSEIKLREYER